MFCYVKYKLCVEYEVNKVRFLGEIVQGVIVRFDDLRDLIEPESIPKIVIIYNL